MGERFEMLPLEGKRENMYDGMVVGMEVRLFLERLNESGVES